MTKSNFPRVQTRFSRLDQSQSCAGSDFDPQSVFSCFGTVCSGISKKNCQHVHGIMLGQWFLNNFFSSMHTVGSRVTKSKKPSNHVKSGQKLQCVVTKKFPFPPGMSGQAGLLKLPIKWPYHNFIN